MYGYARMPACTYIHTYVRTHVCVYVYVYVDVYVCAAISLPIYFYGTKPNGGSKYVVKISCETCENDSYAGKTI